MNLASAENRSATSCVSKVATHARLIISKVKQGDNMVGLVKIEASKLSLTDEFLDYELLTSKEKMLMFRAKLVLEKGVKDFWVPSCAPSFNEEKTGLCFKAGSAIAVGRSYEWSEEAARAIDPMRRTRIITENEHIAFRLWLIKNLIEGGWEKTAAWQAVCVNSASLGNYWDSPNTPHKMEPTGSREVCGICDHGNAYKMIASERDGGFFVAGGHYGAKGSYRPLSDMNYEFRVREEFKNCVPFVIYEVA